MEYALEVCERNEPYWYGHDPLASLQTLEGNRAIGDQFDVELETVTESLAATAERHGGTYDGRGAQLG